MGIGIRIKEVLRERKMTIKELSEKSGVSINTLYSITKRDSMNVDPIILQSISDALKISPDLLKGGYMNEPKLHIRVILKSGVDFTVKCEEFTISRDRFGNPKNYDFKGITENKPLYLDFDQVAAIVRLVSNELEAVCN